MVGWPAKMLAINTIDLSPGMKRQEKTVSISPFHASVHYKNMIFFVALIRALFMLSHLF